MVRIFNLSQMWCGLALLVLLWPAGAFAQELHNAYRGTWNAEVVAVNASETVTIPGTEVERVVQAIEAEVLDGPLEGQTINLDNDIVELDTGDRFFFNYNVSVNGVESYGVTNVDRRGELYFLLGIFVLAVVAFGGWQGVRSITALLGSFFAIFYILIPGILNGTNPILISVLVAAGILFAAIFFTHGFNRESLVAYSGTMISVFLTSVFAIYAVSITNLNGMSSEGATSVLFNTGGTIDFTALLLGAMIIGVLGVLDDIAVTQAAVVTELFSSNRAMSRLEVYRRAIRIGREHVGALVNTLVLAYAGASLPLLLYFSLLEDSSVSMVASTELLATEIVRTIVGSIGLVMAVPIVTLLAVLYLRDYEPKHGHSHSHGHHH